MSFVIVFVGRKTGQVELESNALATPNRKYTGVRRLNFAIDLTPRLQNLIRTQGPIPFAAFMEEALYGEGGYYSREDLPIGEEGDYVTGSSLSPLFGRATARLLQRLDPASARPAELFEAGYGTGAHLESVVATLLERTLGRRVRAWDRVARPVPAGVERVPAWRRSGKGRSRG